MECVTAVKPLPDFQIEVAFDTGHVKIFDMKPYLGKGVFTRLRDTTVFNQAYIDYDTVCWPGNLDMAPDTLFDRGITVTYSSTK
jgi:hypothetical protein